MSEYGFRAIAALAAWHLVLGLAGCRESASDVNLEVLKLQEENSQLTQTAADLGRQLESVQVAHGELLRSVGDEAAHAGRRLELQRELGQFEKDSVAAEQEVVKLKAVLEKFGTKYSGK